MIQVPKFKKPSIYFVYATKPDRLPLKEANALFNEYSAQPKRGLVLFHDHFKDKPGGIAIFYVTNDDQKKALETAGPLEGWEISVHSFIHSFSPSSFDEQIAYTVHNYGKSNWEELQHQDRPDWIN